MINGSIEVDPQAGFCRDCLSLQRDDQKLRCHQCGSPRIIRHKELYKLSIAHIDCDAFYASIEKRDNKALKNQPIIIGGGKRGVVSTACYIARIYGVRSAMPMFKALELCPQAVVIPPNMKKYSEVGRHIRQLMLELTPMVEPISIDEAFMDLSGTLLLHRDPPARVLAKLVKKIEEDIGIIASVGLSYCKYLAKIASDLEKPRGFSVIGRDEATDFLKDKPVSMIWGVGKAFEAKLHSNGIRTIGQLQQMDEGLLIKNYGTMGQRLYYLSRGIDRRPIQPESDIKSISSETTFNIDLFSKDDLAPILRALSEKVATRLKAKNIAGRTIVLKLKTHDFRSLTRNKQIDAPTQLADRIFRTGLLMLEKELNGTKYRLIGIGVSDLTDTTQADPSDLIDFQATKRAKAETAIDKLREKLGGNFVETGYTFGKGTLIKQKSLPDKEGNS